MGWGARTHEGEYHGRRSTPVRLVGKLHNAFLPGGRGKIAGRSYVVDRNGSIRRALVIIKGRAA